ncbi:MAG: hypothetical protein E7055_15035 [Lentisphaerae bacterium]|nr:hypothetical protein [Lentisphaerota bacterium]
MMYRLSGVLSLFTAVWMLSAQDAQVAELNGKIVLDGKLDEPAWQQAVPHSNFQLMKARNKAGRKPSAQTEFRILADPTHIYLGIRCPEPQMNKIRMIGKDKSTNIWGDDAVEVFLAPCGHKEKYYQFVVNAANTQYRQYYEEAGTIMPEEYGGLFESAVYRGDRFWNVELRIPLAAFYHTARPDWKTRWLVNVVRTRPHAGEYSSWSVLTGKYHEPGSFRSMSGFPGKPAEQICFVKNAKVSLTDMKQDGSYTGKIRLQINAEKKSDPLTVSVKSDVIAGDAAGEIRLNRGKNPLTLPAVFRNTGKTQLLISVKNAGGEEIAGREYVLTVKYQPLQFVFTRPFYARSFFPGQDSSRITGKILVSAEVETVALTADGKTCQLPVRNGEAEFDIPNPKNRTKTGLSASLSKNGKRIAECSAEIRVLPPTGRKMVWIESPGRLVVNGKRIFALGWYGGAGKGGFMISEAFAEKYPSPAAKHPYNFGAMVSITPASLIRSAGDGGESNRDVYPSKAMVEKIHQRIDALRSRDFNYYYLADEPEYHGGSAVYLEHMYNIIKEADPYHPVMIITTTPETFINCADILNPHLYIQPAVDDHGRRSLGRPVAAVAEAAKQIMNLGRRDKLVFGTPQVFNYRSVNQYAVFPTFDETNAWIWALIACGGQGLTPFIYYDHASRPDLDLGMDYIYNSIDRLSGLLTAPQEPGKVSADNRNVETRLLDTEQGLLLIAVNVSPEKQQTVVRSPVLEKYRSLYLFREDGMQTLDGGKFELSMDPYQVHIYSSKKLDDGLFPLTELRSRIAAAEKKRCSSPSVLFEKGKRIEISSSQYAVTDTCVLEDKLFDGVHDILAWRPIGGKAPWMELGFRKFTAKFSRLRIYGANLKAPEFSILKYGKWNILQPADIKQGKYWLELDFGKTFSTVKCRIDWKKWTRGLELYEIELIP